jgi:selenide,water dikinase
LPPGQLAQVLRQVEPLTQSDNLLAGPSGYDDVGAVRHENGRVSLHTVDFFPPVVDDAFAYGAIAAANSLSDIYASGGEASIVLNLAGFPKDWGEDVLEQIFAGASKVVAESGALWVGGHTVSSAEPLYGFACYGECKEPELVSNKGAQPGDLLFLTKPLGAGSITTGVKREKASEGVIAAAVAGMSRLNRDTARAMRKAGISTATDITGFGLMGHASNIARASKVNLHIESARLPFYEGAVELASEGVFSGASKRGRETYDKHVNVASGALPAAVDICFDAETSGGLLMCIPPEKVSEMQLAMSPDDLFEQVGEVRNGESLVILE